MYNRTVEYERHSVVQGTGHVELQLDNVRLREKNNHHRLLIRRSGAVGEYNFHQRRGVEGGLRISISSAAARSSWADANESYGGPDSPNRTVRFSIGSPDLTFGLDDLDKLLPPRFPQSTTMIRSLLFGPRLQLAKRFARLTWMSNVVAPWNVEVAGLNEERPEPKRFISQFHTKNKVIQQKQVEFKSNERQYTSSHHHSVCTSKTIQLPIKCVQPPAQKPPQETAETRSSGGGGGQSVSNLVTRFSHISSDTRFANFRRRGIIIDSGGSSGKTDKAVAEIPVKKLSTAPAPLEVSGTASDASPAAAPETEQKAIPKFYFPFGKSAADDQELIERQLSEARVLFEKHDGFLHFCDFPELMKVLALPLYWKSALFRATGAKKKEAVSFQTLASLWLKFTRKYHDNPSRFFHLLAYHRGQEFLEPCDWEVLILDVVNTHPGLRFLKEAKEFISRYCKTVIARIYFTVNRSWSDRITLCELKNSNILEIIEELEKEDDINKFTDYFSYEHFYVIYCKFWEIDTDHDLFVSREDLYHHNQSAISRRIIDRIFSGAVSNSAEIKRGLMSYYEFVWFLIAEEDKRSRTSIEYWFRCMDIDGDGYLSMYELEYFYEEQMQRMEMFGFEFMQFEDVICQMLDLIKPIDRTKIRLMDLKRCKLVNVFLDTFINMEKHLEHDQHDPFASFRGPDVVEVSDWVRYAAEEYENLISEEQLQSNSDEQNFDEAEDETRCTEENSAANASTSYDEGSNNFLVDESSSSPRPQPQLIDTSTL